MKRTALFLRRGFAYLVDGIIVFIVAEILLGAPKAWFGELSVSTYSFLRFAGVLLVAAYFVIAHWRYGRTVGKAMVGLRVVAANAPMITVAQAFIRYLPFLIGALGFALIDVRGWSLPSIPIGHEEIDLWRIVFVCWFAAEAVISLATQGQRSIHDLLARTSVCDAKSA